MPPPSQNNLFLLKFFETCSRPVHRYELGTIISLAEKNGAKIDLCEFGASLVYIDSSRTTRATQRFRSVKNERGRGGVPSGSLNIGFQIQSKSHLLMCLPHSQQIKY